MALILNLETATKNCSVSLSKNGETIAIKELNDGSYSHGEMLHKFICEVLKKANLTYNDLDAIAVSKGPGSYTGLRIGVSAAKGLCFSLDLPLISCDTLKALALSSTAEEGFIVPLLDARRMEVYSAVFSIVNRSIRGIEAEIIEEDSFQDYLEKGKVTFLGDGAEKCKSIITHFNARFEDNKFPSANEMSKLSFEKFQKKDFEDVAYFEPFYLKDFVVTTKKK